MPVCQGTLQNNIAGNFLFVDISGLYKFQYDLNMLEYKIVYCNLYQTVGSRIVHPSCIGTIITMNTQHCNFRDVLGPMWALIRS
jgi:hypothetical protein